MSRNRDLAAAFGVLAVAWPFLGFATGYTAQYIPASVHLLEWALAVLVLIFIPLVRGTTRWTALGAGIVGIIMAIWAISGFFVVPPGAAFAPAAELVFTALFAFFAFRAYREKPPA